MILFLVISDNLIVKFKIHIDKDLKAQEQAKVNTMQGEAVKKIADWVLLKIT